jgi:hypothetical protein
MEKILEQVLNILTSDDDQYWLTTVMGMHSIKDLLSNIHTIMIKVIQPMITSQLVNNRPIMRGRGRGILFTGSATALIICLTEQIVIGRHEFN